MDDTAPIRINLKPTKFRIAMKCKPVGKWNGDGDKPNLPDDDQQRGDEDGTATNSNND